MQVTGNNGIGSKLKILLQICFYGGIIILIALPFLLKALGLHLNATAIVIYPNGTVLLIITYKFIKLFESLEQNQPFCDKNVKILRSAGLMALIEAVLWFIDLSYEIILVKEFDIIVTVILSFIIILFLVIALALYILSELFRESTEYKKENELTI